jgi:hypothetical protein
MNVSDIPNLRLHNQHLSNSTLNEPDDVVAWLGAVQSQDYAGAKWALGLRSQGITDSDIDKAFNTGAILRTHVMRPTWHFVTLADIRWMLSLTAPRVHAANSHYYRKLELDDALFVRSNAVLAKALEGGNQLTRQELRGVLEQEGITSAGENGLLRLGYMIMRAELDAVICSGARRGKQFTYALLDERAPQAKTLERDEALATLTQRYFTSHGPAMIKDFVWWSGLTTADARVGLEMAKSQLIEETIEGKTYWFSSSRPLPNEKDTTAFFLPNFDEYTIAYADYSAIFDPAYGNRFDTLFPHSIVIAGQVVGAWRRVVKKDGVVITTKLFTTLADEQKHSLALAARRYSEFLDLPVNWS